MNRPGNNYSFSFGSIYLINVVKAMGLLPFPLYICNFSVISGSSQMVVHESWLNDRWFLEQIYLDHLQSQNSQKSFYIFIIGFDFWIRPGWIKQGRFESIIFPDIHFIYIYFFEYRKLGSLCMNFFYCLLFLRSIEKNINYKITINWLLSHGNLKIYSRYWLHFFQATSTFWNSSVYLCHSIFNLKDAHCSVQTWIDVSC